MKLDQEYVEALRRRFETPGDAPRPSACPSSDRIWDASHGDLPPAEVRVVVNHLHACPSCAAEWRAAAMTDDGTAEDSKPRRPTPAVWMAMAAMLILAAALLFTIRPGASPEEPVFRNGVERGIRSLVPDRAVLPRGAFLLRWEAVEDGARYDVQLDRENLTPVHEARDLEVSELLVPEAALADVPPGETLVWRVEAHLVDGSLLRSGAFLVRLP